MSIRNPQTPEERAIRRAQWRKSKQREKERRHRALQTGVICHIKTGRYGQCAGRIVELVDRIGRVQYYCERCIRRQSGICQECPRPVYGKRGWAQYCADCKRRVMAAQNRKWVIHNRERKNASVRAWRKRHRRTA